MKTFLLIIATLFISLSSFAGTKIVELSSDKTAYAEGDSAVLRANFVSKPDNSDFSLDIVGTLNNSPLASDRITDFEIFSKTAALTEGNYTWTVQVVIQDTKYAQDLKDTIRYYADEIYSLNAKIAAETDPAKLANLIARRDSDLSSQGAAQAELTSIRSPVLSPISLTFSVQ